MQETLSRHHAHAAAQHESLARRLQSERLSSSSLPLLTIGGQAQAGCSGTWERGWHEQATRPPLPVPLQLRQVGSAAGLGGEPGDRQGEEEVGGGRRGGRGAPAAGRQPQLQLLKPHSTTQQLQQQGPPVPSSSEAVAPVAGHGKHGQERTGVPRKGGASKGPGPGVSPPGSGGAGVWPPPPPMVTNISLGSLCSLGAPRGRGGSGGGTSINTRYIREGL